MEHYTVTWIFFQMFLCLCNMIYDILMVYKIERTTLYILIAIPLGVFDALQAHPRFSRF